MSTKNDTPSNQVDAADLSRRSAAKFFGVQGVAFSSADQTWTTPPQVIDGLARAGFRFDLDPCANDRSIVPAQMRLSANDNGLAVAWRGDVFVNPPYSRALAQWMAKCADEAASSDVRIIALVPARPDTRWWHDHVANRADVLFLKGRLKFGRANGEKAAAAPFPSCLVLWGFDQPMVHAVQKEFAGSWLAAAPTDAA